MKTNFVSGSLRTSGASACAAAPSPIQSTRSNPPPRSLEATASRVAGSGSTSLCHDRFGRQLTDAMLGEDAETLDVPRHQVLWICRRFSRKHERYAIERRRGRSRRRVRRASTRRERHRGYGQGSDEHQPGHRSRLVPDRSTSSDPRSCGSRPTELRLLADHLPRKLLKLGTRHQPEIVGQCETRLLVHLERVCVSTRAVESEHELPDEAFSIGISADQHLKLADEPFVAAQRQLGVETLFESTQAQLLEPLRFGGAGGNERDVGQGWPAPARARSGHRTSTRRAGKTRPTRGRAPSTSGPT